MNSAQAQSENDRWFDELRTKAEQKRYERWVEAESQKAKKDSQDKEF